MKLKLLNLLYEIYDENSRSDNGEANVNIENDEI